MKNVGLDSVLKRGSIYIIKCSSCGWVGRWTTRYGIVRGSDIKCPQCERPISDIALYKERRDEERL